MSLYIATARTSRRAVLRLGSSAAAVAILAACWPIEPAAKARRVGYLGTNWFDQPENGDAFKQGLFDLGWEEGRNVAFEWRSSTGLEPHLSDILAELLPKVDVVVVGNEPNARAVQRASSTMPIVLAAHPDPVATGLVASLARPGGTITGMGTSPAGVIFAKRIELLEQTVPGLARVGVLYNAVASPATAMVQVPAVRASAERLGIDVHLADARTADEILPALHRLAGERVSALFVLQDPINFAHRQSIVQFASQTRLPGLFPNRDWVEIGGLMSFSSSASAQQRQVAGFVDRILRGAQPADIPIQQPDIYELHVNAKTAALLGLTLPESVALQVTHWVG